MALDTKTGHLVFGWYDGRHDPSFTGLQYYAAVIPAKKLDKLVAQIPLSNPVYHIPAGKTLAKQDLQQNHKAIKTKRNKRHVSKTLMKPKEKKS